MIPDWKCKLCGGKTGDPRSKVCVTCHTNGSNNPMWRGEAVGYAALHSWIKRRLPKPATCASCSDPARDLANKSGEYKRDVSDWEWLCRVCHMKSDGRLKAFASRGKERAAEARLNWRCFICNSPADYKLSHVCYCVDHWNFGNPITPADVRVQKKEDRDKELCANSRTHAPKELAAKYGITIHRVYQILRKARNGK